MHSLDLAPPLGGTDSIENVLKELFQTYGLLCREFGMPIIHNISPDPCYNEVVTHLQQKIEEIIPNHVPLAVCLDTDEYFLGNKNEFNINELIVWRGNASIITGHGYYFVQCDGNEVTIAGEGAFVPWSTLFNLLQAKLYSHRESDEEGCVFWVGDSENVLIP